MLNGITWSSFLATLATIVIAYYLYVLTFYRKDISAFFSPKKKHGELNPAVQEAIPQAGKEPSNSIIPRDESEQTSFTLVHELLEDLKQLFLRAQRTKMIKEELVQAIRSKINAYPKIGETDLLDDINTHIIMEAKDKCDLEILSGDIKQIWE